MGTIKKLFALDEGIARESEQITTHPLRGEIFETFIISELMKSRFNHGERADLFFWRDSNGNEVNVIFDQGGKLMPLEIKSGKTLTKESTAGLKKWVALTENNSIEPTLIYGGDESCKFSGIQITSWRETGDIFSKVSTN